MPSGFTKNGNVTNVCRPPNSSAPITSHSRDTIFIKFGSVVFEEKGSTNANNGRRNLAIFIITRYIPSFKFFAT